MTAGGASALYAYCLSRAGAAAGVSGGGLDSEPVEEVVAGEVAAVISAAKVGDYQGPAAEARMRDLAWIVPRACRHEEVIESVMRGSPVVPLRFATLFSSRASLETWLEVNREAIAAALGRLAGHEEWAVRVGIDRPAAEAPLVAAALQRLPASASPGVRYMEERRIRAGIGRELSAWVEEVCNELAGRLRADAADFCERPVGAAEAGDGAAPICHWAFLVPAARVARFREYAEQAAAGYAERGVTVACSGPWPPYSFCPALGG